MDFGDIFEFKIKSTVKTIPQLLEYLKESYSDDDIHKVINDVIGHIEAHIDPSTRDIIVAMAEVDMNKSMAINGKYVNWIHQGLLFVFTYLCLNVQYIALCTILFETFHDLYGALIFN